MSVQLYLGDCLEILPTLAAGSVDAVVTDPPYGIGRDRGNWNDDPERYPDLIQTLVAEANRMTCGGPVFVWQALPNLHRFHEWFPPSFRVMAACKGFVQYRPTAVQWSWDPVVFWGKIRNTPSVYSKDYYVASPEFGSHVDHPSPRPLAQTAYIVNLATLQNDICLDPFMGSGTTGVACVQTGRRFVGIEISEEYFKVAQKRIAAAQAQLRIPFDPMCECDGNSRKAIQGSLGWMPSP